MSRRLIVVAALLLWSAGSCRNQDRPAPEAQPVEAEESASTKVEVPATDQARQAEIDRTCSLGYAGPPPVDDEPDPEPKVVLPDESAYTPSPRDGKGTATVTPTVVGVREPVTLTFTYAAEGGGIAVGGGVVCMVSQFWNWTPPQGADPQAPGYVTVR